jgi:nitroreductase
MDKPVTDIIRQRFSCRSYCSKPIMEEDQESLRAVLGENQTGPFGNSVRMTVLAATDENYASLKGLGTYGYIKQPQGFLVGALEKSPKYLEEYGYVLERIILAATEREIGTCWLGGTFTKSSFAKSIALKKSEQMPAVIALGYFDEADERNIRMRKRIGALQRIPAEQLFFEEEFGRILSEQAAGKYAVPLEMVRLAPSASNKQPWRIVHQKDRWHFYLQRTPGYGKGTLIYMLMRLADLQRVDIGIAMCHFELTANECGLGGTWEIDPPLIPAPEGTEYITTWKETTSR